MSSAILKGGRKIYLAELVLLRGVMGNKDTSSGWTVGDVQLLEILGRRIDWVVGSWLETIGCCNRGLEGVIGKIVRIGET